jgi:hypothetical protein
MRLLFKKMHDLVMDRIQNHHQTSSLCEFMRFEIPSWQVAFTSR